MRRFALNAIVFTAQALFLLTLKLIRNMASPVPPRRLPFFLQKIS